MYGLSAKKSGCCREVAVSGGSTVFLSDGEDFEVNPKPKPKPRLLLSKTFFSEVLFLLTFSENEKNSLKRHANY